MWNEVVKQLFSADSFGYPAPQSKGPDLLFNGTRIIAWQAKLLSKSAPLTWAGTGGLPFVDIYQ